MKKKIISVTEFVKNGKTFEYFVEYTDNSATGYLYSKPEKLPKYIQAYINKHNPVIWNSTENEKGDTYAGYIYK